MACFGKCSQFSILGHFSACIRSLKIPLVKLQLYFLFHPTLKLWQLISNDYHLISGPNYTLKPSFLGQTFMKCLQNMKCLIVIYYYYTTL